MRMSVALSGFFLLLVASLTIFIPFTTDASCERPGSVEITSETRATARAAGIPDFCSHWIPGQPYVGQNVGEAKAYLNSLPKRPLSNCAPPDQNNITRLNDTFATCAAQFLKAYTERYGTIYITSAFRDDRPGSAQDGSGQSANKCAGGVNGSNHSIGIAMDVNPANDSLYPTLWKFASDNPQFGICFPHQYGGANTTGLRDRPHMVLAGSVNGRCGGECMACSKQGVTASCSGTPTNIRTTPYQSSPTAGIAQSLRNWLSPQQPQTQPQPQIAPTVSQPAPVSQNPLSAFQQQQQPQTIGGVSGQLTMTPVTPTGSTVADRLETLAFPTTTETGSTATTVPIIVSQNQAAQLTAEQPVAVTPVNGGSGTVAPSQTTFISGDLSWQGAPQPPQQLTGFQATLANVRAILERILEFLTPFNARNALRGDVGDQEIYIVE